jgi:pyrroline-5-carboxylate reductase
MKIAMVGCGTMGSAFARQLISKGSVFLFDQDREKAKVLSIELKCAFADKLFDAVQGAEIIFLAIKPKDLPKVAEIMASLLNKNQMVISMLAGTSLAVLRRYFPKPALLRIMPNLALICSEGIIGLVEEGISVAEKGKIDPLFKGMGLLIWMEESRMEALTALAASGIGMVFLMIEAMIEGGILIGFNPLEARELVLKTLQGAVALLNKTQKHPAELKWNIASPGGTTIAGLKRMEECQVRSGIMNAILASYEKAKNQE